MMFTRYRLLQVVAPLALLAGCSGGGTTSLNNAGGLSGFSVGGTLAGLASGESVVLEINGGNAQTVAEGGAFAFSGIALNASYSVTVATPPPGQTCTVAGGSGTVTSANVANIVVTCSDQAFSLGGTIQGLNGAGLVLADGTNSVTVSSGATTFALPTAVAFTSSYAVTVKTQPAGLACAVTAGTGTMPAHAATTVSVRCTDQPFTLGGTLSGLGANTGLILKNGADSRSVPANATTFVMPTAVSFDSPYAVSVQRAPSGLTCTIVRGSGTMPASNVTNVGVTCADQAYTVGGSVTGLTTSGLVLVNGTDTLTVPANSSSFTMPTSVATASPYALVVQTQPSSAICTITNGSGTMGTSPVTNIAVTCAPAFTVGGTISGLGSASGLVLVNGSDTLTVLANATSFSMPTGVANGSSYNVTVQAHPPVESCPVTNGAGIVAGVDITNVAVACAPGTESVLYSFGATVVDAINPLYAGLLLASDGNFYGMAGGGTNNKGALFKITPAGDETVLWSFGAGTDGQSPTGGLIQASDGNFYGMTNAGGANAAGTVFKITPAGAETVLWSFGAGTDGSSPYGNLVQGSDGNFYGTTESGGANANDGTVFKITPAGVETVLHSFAGGSDGNYPYGSLIQGSDGNFYGMTANGGTNGAGTVFKITPAGAETVLWSFAGGSDGNYPQGSLIQGSDGNFYGMTDFGGTNGDGTVFKLTPAGVETVLWSFGSGSDGQIPYGSLVQGSDGNFYGMTNGGGDNAGTIFQITPSGSETVLWSFGTGTDGNYPYGDLIFGPDGTLYGLTYTGGTNNDGAVIEFQ
jgi:uncharacterized repeat protein (TIGR03803 family)